MYNGNKIKLSMEIIIRLRLDEYKTLIAIQGQRKRAFLIRRINMRNRSNEVGKLKARTSS